MRALITRPAEDAAPLAEALRARDIEPLLDPMLRIEIEGDAAVPLEGVQAVLFTSTNGVRAFARRESRRDLPVYAVGDTTASAARQAGFAEVKSAGGDSAALARLVAGERDPKAGTLLHARGAHVAGDLAGALSATGFELRAAELYRAAPAETLSDETRRALAEGTLDFALFFSPRTAGTFATLVRAASLTEALAPVAAVCLSQAVADSLGALPWRRVAVARRPTQGALLAALDAELPARAETKMAEQPRKTDAPAPAPPPPRAGRASTAIAVIALVVALAGAAAGTFPLWRASVGLGTGAGAAAQRIDTLDSDLAALKSQLGARMADLAKQQNEIGGKADGNTKALYAASRKLAALDDRVGKLAQTSGTSTEMAGRVDALAKRLDALEAKTKTLGGESGRFAPVANTVKTLEPRVASLADKVKALESRVASLAKAQKAKPGGAAGLVVAAASLAEAVRTGQPYGTPLATVSTLARTDMDIQHQVATLLPNARAGVPTMAALAARFPAVADAVTRAAIAPKGANWPDRILARLANLVTVRRTGSGAKGDSPAAIVARAEAKLKTGDLDGAVADVAKLQGAPARAAAGWLANARARRDALRASQALSNLAMQLYLHPPAPSAPAGATPPASQPPQ